MVLFFIASHTGQMVKRAAVGAEGFVLDHYDRSAIDIHLKTVGEPMLKALANTPPHAIFSDSLEVYNADWTSDFLAAFRARRGYDLSPYLPALAGDIGDNTFAIRHDWARTLTELFEERYLIPLGDWAHAHKTLLRSQTYGIPPASLSSNSLVDLPEGEGADWRQFSTTRWASSASHLYAPGHLFGNMDLASLARVSRDAAGHEGRGRSSFSARHQPVGRARLALFATRRR